jgi:hypothetical protein
MLGISLVSLIVWTNSCKTDKDYLVTGTYVYLNETDSVIEIERGQYPFVIYPKQSHTITASGEGPEFVTVNNYVSPFNGEVVIIYGMNKCDTLFNPTEGILDLKNYVVENIDAWHYKFTYTFTLADMDKAVPCE